MTTFAYAQARIQARHGRRPDDALWAQLEASRTLQHYLERARSTVLEQWTAVLDPKLGVHEIERTLRSEFRAYVRQVAEWAPERWQKSIRFVARLVDVPLLESREPPPWGAADTELELARHELEAALPSESPLDVWSRRFHELLPAMVPSKRRALDKLVSAIAHHRQRVLAAEQQGGETDVARLRRELGRELGQLFRRYPEQPAALFVHLALVALDLEQLRAALVVRALFEQGGESTWA